MRWRIHLRPCGHVMHNSPCTWRVCVYKCADLVVHCGAYFLNMVRIRSWSASSKTSSTGTVWSLPISAYHQLLHFLLSA
ncbi:hypothetical protein T4E_11832 [Trichinella pseudospiralis]|uniref:Uncharacterized protein n=1 Tax=Trichinella pseudospiralis TaxID=6337 RepID=A0A0V0XFK9_TRIPS|nr:hypothetical protein T4E_11832 [Trichinella pseudospiralis]